MRQPNVPEGVDAELVAAIRRDVKLEEVIRCYHENLYEELRSQRGRHRRLDSPFGPPGNKAVVIFQNPDSKKEELHWADPLAPKSVPRDVIGFQMAFSSWSHEDAVERLAAFREDDLEIDREIRAPINPMSYPKGWARADAEEDLAEQDRLEHAEETLVAETRYTEERRVAIRDAYLFDGLRRRTEAKAAAVIAEPKKE